MNITPSIKVNVVDDNKFKVKETKLKVPKQLSKKSQKLIATDTQDYNIFMNYSYPELVKKTRDNNNLIELIKKEFGRDNKENLSSVVIPPKEEIKKIEKELFNTDTTQEEQARAEAIKKLQQKNQKRVYEGIDPKKLYEEMTAKYMPSFDLTTPTNKKPKKTNNINKLKDVMKVSDKDVNTLIEDTYKKYTPQTNLQTFNLTDTKEEKRINSRLKELERQMNNSKRDKTKNEKQEQINKLKNKLSKLNKSF